MKVWHVLLFVLLVYFLVPSRKWRIAAMYAMILAIFFIVPGCRSAAHLTNVVVGGAG